MLTVKLWPIIFVHFKILSCGRVNPLPNSNFLDWTEFKALADKKLHATKIKISVIDRVENIVGKGENVGYQHFLLFLQCFQKLFLLGLLRTRRNWKVEARNKR